VTDGPRRGQGGVRGPTPPDEEKEERDNDLDLEESCPVYEVSIIVGGPLV